MTAHRPRRDAPEETTRNVDPREPQAPKEWDQVAQWASELHALRQRRSPN